MVRQRHHFYETQTNAAQHCVRRTSRHLQFATSVDGTRTPHRPRAARIVINVATKAKSRNNPDYKIASNADGVDAASVRRRFG
jgi:hypothetical protein